MAKGTGKRLANSTAFFPQWIWNWIDVKEGEEIDYQDDKGKNGHFISFWKKNKD